METVVVFDISSNNEGIDTKKIKYILNSYSSLGDGLLYMNGIDYFGASVIIFSKKPDIIINNINDIFNIVYEPCSNDDNDYDVVYIESDSHDVNTVTFIWDETKFVFYKNNEMK